MPETMTPPRTFTLEVSDGVATVTLDRADTLNALTLDTYRELRDVFQALQDDRLAPGAAPEAGGAVRAVIVTGAGAGFCSGADIDDLIAQLTKMSTADILAFTRLCGETVLAMRRLRKPIIAAINGVAVGAGAALAIAADIRIASDLARFGFIFPRMGLSAAEMGTTWLLPRIIGLGRATELLLTGDIIDVYAAERQGLVSRVVPGEQLMPAARELAARLATGPTFAYGMTKEMLEREANMDLASALAAEAQAQQICTQSLDFREAYRAIVRQRRPRFQGR
ncbi:MAG: enoyl-CoA hydratase family protein [Pseudomonadota bacterium]